MYSTNFLDISMIAVIKTGGKQYPVKIGQIVMVEKIEGKKGDSVSLDKVMLLSNASNHIIGNPLIKGATVQAKILEHKRSKKVIVFKKRKRQNYRLTQGHRQHITVLKIESINQEDKKVENKTKDISTNTSKSKTQTKKVAKKSTAAKVTTKKDIKKKVSKKVSKIKK